MQSSAPHGSPRLSTLATTLSALIAGLLEQFADEGIPVPSPPPLPASPEEAAAALFSIAARTRTLVFSVWADADGDDLTAGASFFTVRADAPGHQGMLGQDRLPVRQPFAPALHASLSEALHTLSQRGQDEARPARGTVAYPPSAEDPDVLFWVTFQEGPVAPSVTVYARDRQLRAAQPPFTALGMKPSEAAFLTERFLRLDTLFQGQPVVFSGARGTGRSTSLHAAMEALPDFTNVLVALEQPRAVDARLGMVKVGDTAPLAQVVRAFLRQDPDVILADEPRGPQDLQVLINSALTGHATAFVLEAQSPEAVLAKLHEALPEVPVTPLIVHHVLDAATGKPVRTLHTVTRDDSGQSHVGAWAPPAVAKG
ncbi:Flp pilus assembly complex ATPase component TadA [Myxococcus sp. CA056]|uniref:ATPase, T2SS/T4P/T4SS family n=1 Tax=Myxococcus sp. CA056 TaxID=2741740 RepID=UPI00157B7C52|nr:ATPase, T2SS/T4P/T4SS family [Myxococcus sp. CA056]NTX09909.1 Flp pilus assembly complex ATPase component TadA [Myxococcus sp. CA056]